MQHEAGNEARWAEHSLTELDQLSDRTRLASRSMGTGFPLVGWGIAWMVGFAGADLVDGPARIAIAVVAWLTGMALSWLPRRAMIRSGHQRALRQAWFVVLVASPFFVAAAQPPSWSSALLLVGALWGLAMCLYAVATHDLVFAFVAGIGVVAAGVGPVFGLPHLLLAYGLTAGSALVALGVVRLVQAGEYG